MSEIIQRFEPGTLWARVKARTSRAIDRGAIQSIPTHSEWVEQGGVTFLIRVVANLTGKAQARTAQQSSSAATRTSRNPFLPYDPDLFVTDISNTHVCLLNKFNVLDHHILMVTRSFQEQESLLTLSDFEAVWLCLREYEGLAFYNAGEAAGASQRHKHLQMVPLPLTAEVPHLPFEPLWRTARFEDMIGVVPRLPFVHGVMRLNPYWFESSSTGARDLHQQYLNLLRAVGLLGPQSEGEQRNPRPYNLLVTRQWMFLVPRSTECFLDISVNALGFAGGLLVRDEEQLARLKLNGPMTALQDVALPAPPVHAEGGICRS